MRRIAQPNHSCLYTSLLVISALFLCAGPLSAESKKETVLVKVIDGGRGADIARRHGLKVKRTFGEGNSSVLVVEEAHPALLKDRLKNEPGIAWVAPNNIIKPLDGETVLPLGETVLPLGAVAESTTEDSIFQLLDGETVLPLEEQENIKNSYAGLAKYIMPSERLLIQPALHRIGLYRSVPVSATGRGVIVADLDTGVDTCHEALRGVLAVSFVDETTVPENCPTAATIKVPGYGHGTAVGSLIRIVAPEAQLWSLRVFDSTGTALISDVYEAIVYAADRRVNVINMSFGTYSYSEALSDAVKYAADRGVVLIAAAGNDGIERLMFPARLSKVKGVVATNIEDYKAHFSNFGSNAFLSAPGVKVYAAYPDHMISVASGTSYASALVAGEAALVVESYMKIGILPESSRIEKTMAEGVQSIDDLQLDLQGKLGNGRIWVPGAVRR